jgi:membrane protein insertase Oxa1/YidC/SpoIIIJ
MSLYWLVSGLVAYIQQAYLLKQDEYQLEAIANSKTATSGGKARSGVTTTIITSEAKTSGPKKAVATSSSKNSKNQKHKKRRR